MKYKCVICFFILVCSNFTFASQCKLFFTTQNRMATEPNLIPEIKELSKVASKVLKESFDIINKFDHATLGLFAAVVTKGHMSLEELKPVQWDKLNIARIFSCWSHG